MKEKGERNITTNINDTLKPTHTRAHTTTRRPKSIASKCSALAAGSPCTAAAAAIVSSMLRHTLPVRTVKTRTRLPAWCQMRKTGRDLERHLPVGGGDGEPRAVCGA